MRTGDHVRHRPSGEVWVVAYVRPETDDLAWCGWPHGLARMYDCEMVKACSDEDHVKLLTDMSRVENDSRGSYARRAIVLRARGMPY